MSLNILIKNMIIYILVLGHILYNPQFSIATWIKILYFSYIFRKIMLQAFFMAKGGSGALEISHIYTNFSKAVILFACFTNILNVILLNFTPKNNKNLI